MNEGKAENFLHFFLRSLSPRRELIKFLRNILGISSIIIIY